MTLAARLSAALAGRYRIERELGAGGMATVYLAEDLKHDRKVAIKVLKPELAAVLGAERFVVEIKTTAAMSHPHILPLFDSGTADGFLFYVMPYIQGETIREKLNRETQFGVDEAVRIAREIADALDYAHRHGVIHRDIKPENILLHDGRAMVMDFGIALAVSAAAGGRMTETGLSLGTPHYMSPEQATAEKEITPRADVYSLGSVLYEMLTGNAPFTGANAQQIIMKIITEPAESVTKYRKSVPSNVAAAVAKSLEKLPADRFDSAKAFADALGNATYRNASGMAAGAAPDARWRQRATWLAAALVLVALAGAFGWLRRPTEAPGPVSRFVLADADSSNAPDSRTVPNFALSPDGSQFAYAGFAPGVGTVLRVRRRDQLVSTVVPFTEHAVEPVFSPSGEQIAFIDDRTNVPMIVSLAGGTPVALPVKPFVSRTFAGATWADDGYLYFGRGGVLERVAATGLGSSETIVPEALEGERVGYSWPQTLPGSRGLLLSVQGMRGKRGPQIGVLDLATNRVTVFAPGASVRYVSPGYLVVASVDGQLSVLPFDAKRLRATGALAALDQVVRVSGALRACFAVADDGSLVYQTGTTETTQSLVWHSRDGATTPVDSTWKRDFSTLALSTDGKQVAVAIRDDNKVRQLWIKQLDHGPLSKLTFDSAGSHTPAWTPDGKSVAYLASRDSERVVYMKPADGSREEQRIWKSPSRLATLAWSPDGRWLLATTAEQGSDIVALRLGVDTMATPLVNSPANEREPALSPDGRWLAYESDESGVLEVYVRPFPDTKASRTQVSVRGGRRPHWSTNGRELFYVSGSEMVATPVTTGASFTHGDERALFPATSNRWDVAPGDRFLMVVGDGLRRLTETVKVENWVTEMRAKLNGAAR
ncbi:MAG: serine/threonine-protein kinase [Gemmatimonadaceae bacterium]|nr:serine/threonine-protein kinase [Gemmatimonadaceae bacterium]